jgi:hypothetical protein
MFAKTLSDAMALLGLRAETPSTPEPEELEAPSIDIGYLDLNDPCEAFRALRRVVALARAEQRQERGAGRFDLAA